MYMCIDTQVLWYDESENKRVVYDYQGIKTVNDLLYNITPASNTTYYCWEDNSLWLWMNKWISLYTSGDYPSAYAFSGYPSEASPQTLTSIYNLNEVLDNNGLLGDGSVVIRDGQRIIKGKLYINDDNDNLTISSYLGGGIRLLPNGLLSSEGEFYINDDGTSYLRSGFKVLNNEMYVDYSENPDKDDNEYQNDTHIYKLFHEGNLDTSAIKVLTPLEIYNKLLDDSLPNPFEFNVSRLNGKTSSDFAKVAHTHSSSDITDFNEKARSQASIEVKTVFSNMDGEGIDVSYNTTTSDLKITANDFTLTFGGGATGSGTIKALSDTGINLVVDPDKHIHQNYLDTMDDLQDQIDNINALNPDDYYNKTQVDEKISIVAGTTTPTSGKALLVNSDLILPGTSLSSQKFDSEKTLSLTGDITGELTTDFSGDTISIATDASNIISESAEAGKALKVNSEGNLDVNTTSSSKLDHNITITLTNEVTGTILLNTSLTEISASITLNPGDNILQTKDLGNTIAQLVDGKVPSSQLPATEAGLVPVGFWNASTGDAPSESPNEGEFWVVDTSGTFENNLYQVNDWCLYLNSSWHLISTNQNVISVNEKQGNVTLDASDINAISTSYLDYTKGETIPANKIITAYEDGVIKGASVDNLTGTFSILTDTNTEIDIATDSTQVSTNGANDLQLKLLLNNNAYESIKDNVIPTIVYNNQELDYASKITLDEGFNVLVKDDNIVINTIREGINIFYWMFGQNDEEMIEFLNNYYLTRDDLPLYIICDYEGQIIIYIIDSNSPEFAQGSTIKIENNNTLSERVYNSDSISLNEYYYDLNITFADQENLLVSTVAIVKDIKLSTKVLVLEEDSSIVDTYLPTQDYNPATKKYVDSKFENTFYSNYIGDGEQTEFILTHNLGSKNVIVQCRNASGEQVYMYNKIKDENTVVIITNEALADSEVQVFIYKLD